MIYYFARANVFEESKIAINRRSQQVGVSETTTLCGLLKDSALKAKIFK